MYIYIYIYRERERERMGGRKRERGVLNEIYVFFVPRDINFYRLFNATGILVETTTVVLFNA